MSRTTAVTEAVGCCDLAREAVDCESRGVLWAVVKRPYVANSSITVTTVITSEGRAGQVINGDAVWGDWDESAQTITLDSGLVRTVDGGEYEP